MASVPDVVGAALFGAIGACFVADTLVHASRGLRRSAQGVRALALSFSPRRAQWEGSKWAGTTRQCRDRSMGGGRGGEAGCVCKPSTIDLPEPPFLLPEG